MEIFKKKINDIIRMIEEKQFDEALKHLSKHIEQMQIKRIALDIHNIEANLYNFRDFQYKAKAFLEMNHPDRAKEFLKSSIKSLDSIKDITRDLQELEKKLE